MATFIVDTLRQIDTAVAAYAESVFTGVAGPMQGVILAMGLVGMPLLAMNAALQFRPMQLSQYMTWAIRYVIILSVATTWTQFLPIYTILTEVPGSYGASLLSASGFLSPTTEGLNAAMDEMVTSIFAFSDQANENSGFFGISLTAVLLMFLGSLMACVAIIISALGKIGLALSVSLAPIMISGLMFSGTSQLFTSWSRFTIGFAMIPLVLAGIMGAVIGVGQGLIGDVGGATELSQAAGFIIVVLAAVFMMFQVPTLVSSLSGSIVSAAGAGFVAANASGVLGTIAGGASRINASNREARIARDAGGTTAQIQEARLAGLRQSAFVREGRREELRRQQLQTNNRKSSRNPASTTTATTRNTPSAPTNIANIDGPPNSVSRVNQAAFTSPRRSEAS